MASRVRVGHFAALLSSSALLTDLRIVHAEEDPKMFVDAAAGVGLTAGLHSYLVEGDFLSGHFRGYTRDSAAGPVVNVGLTAGIGWQRLAVGAGFDATFMESTWKTEFGGGSADVLSGSVVTMFRLGGGLRGSAAIGYASAGMACQEVAGFFESGSTCGSRMRGPRFALTIGHTWSSGFGVATTGSYAYLSADESKYMPLTMLVQATFSGW